MPHSRSQRYNDYLSFIFIYGIPNSVPTSSDFSSIHIYGHAHTKEAKSFLVLIGMSLRTSSLFVKNVKSHVFKNIFKPRKFLDYAVSYFHSFSLLYYGYREISWGGGAVKRAGR
jgi:hypothetical protein